MQDLVKRFWNKVDKKENNCWVWKGATEVTGYGKFSLEGSTKQNYKTGKAHRLSYEIHFGEIPNGLCVCHTCDNRLCVNPEHLWLGTREDNNKDRKAKGRNGDINGEKHGRVKLKASYLKDILKKKEEGLSYTRIAKEYGVCQSTISRMVKGVNWKSLYKA